MGGGRLVPLTSPFNEALINECIQNRMALHQLSGKDTFTYYMRTLRQWSHFLETRGEHLLSATTPSFFAHLRQIEKVVAPGSVHQRFSIIASFYKWAISPGIEKLTKNPCPKAEVYRTDNPGIVPNADQVFQMRAQGGANLLGATVFEMVLSSGMRAGELVQLRACDIQWKSEILDAELERASPYVGASIDLDPTIGIPTKRQKRRTVYLSILACRLLKLYIHRIGIDPDSSIPLFPYDRNYVSEYIGDIGTDIMRKTTKARAASAPRQSFLNDMTEERMDALHLSDSHRKAIQEVRRKHNSILQKGCPDPTQNTRGVIKPRIIAARAHKFRHFFGAWQYYRSYFGTRRDVVVVRDLLGHATVSESNVYLRGQIYIRNDREWKQIALGNPFDYKRFWADPNEPVKKCTEKYSPRKTNAIIPKIITS